MKIRLVCTSDVHGYIMPYSYADNKSADHGLLKLKSTINALRDEHTLVIDNGDILQGSPLLTYYYGHKNEYVNPIEVCVKDIGYDYVNVGNHDLNYGYDNLRNYLDNNGARCLVGNLKYKGEYIGNEYVIHEFDADKRIALIGVVTHYIVNWEKPDNLKDIEIENAFDYVKKTVRKIKETENVDGIVVVYHGGYEADLNTGKLTQQDTGEDEAYRMCKEIEGIDVLISGHQHRSLAGKCVNTYTSQTACNGKEVAVYDWDLDTHEINVSMVKNDYDADRSLMNKIMPLEEAVQKWLDEPCGEILNYDLRIKDEFDARLHKHPLISFLNQIQREKCDSDLSGNALFNNATGFNSVITTRDVVSTYVYPNTLVVFEITGKILKEYLEKCAEYFCIEDGNIAVSKEYIYPKPAHFNYDMVDGVDYTIKVSNEKGNRITDLRYKDKNVRDDDIFTLSLNNYRASGGGNFFMFREARIVKEIQEDMVEVILEYLSKHKKVEVNHRDNIKVII
ncbi:MAG: bifunctional metallophosphatase/5'-nucleotidase [Erysipelotrichaceae bacterium]